MTNAPRTANPEPVAQAVAADATPTDFAARGPLLLLLGSGIVWLVLSGVLALITSIQLHSPHFLSQYACLTFGRVDAMRETAFLYGWAGNAGLGIVLWILLRLSAGPLRAKNWILLGALFWNLALTAGLVGIAAGDLTTFSMFQLPRYVQPIMAVAYAAIAVAGVLAWLNRKTPVTFAAQWYAVAALFILPWLSSIAQLVLLWAPLRGVAQAVGAGWYAQGVWALWLVPLALAVAYYVTPKVTGRVLPQYDAAPVAFWTLLVLGGFRAGRHLIGGPVPAWIASVAIVASIMLVVHYFVVVLNLRPIWGARGTTASFVGFGLAVYLLAGVVDAVTAIRGVAVVTQFTFLEVAQQQLGLYGAVTMILFGGIYFMVPRLTGAAWVSPGLTFGHKAFVVLGVILLVAALTVAGVTQSRDFADPNVTFQQIFENTRIPLLVVSGAYLTLLGANILLLVNFVQTISASVTQDVIALSPIRATEASAS